jgi:hypothetical protein
MTAHTDPVDDAEPTRLLDGDAEGEARTRALLGALGKTHVSPSAKARVRAALTAEPRPRKATTGWLVPALAAAMLLGTAIAGASGHIGRHLPFVESGAHDGPSHPEKIPTATSPAAARATPARSPLPNGPAAPPTVDVPTSPAPVEAPIVEAPVVAPPPPAALRAPDAPRAPAPPTKAPAALAPAAPEKPVVEPASYGGDLVVSAMRALRKENDPARASRLLAEYRSAHARGPLDEEATALAIEAGLRLGDGSAPRHAKAYLERYPAGRFAKMAEGALSPR